MFLKISHILFFVVVTATAFTQNFEQDLKSIVQQIDSSKNTSIAVKVNVYQRKGGKLIYSTTCLSEHQQKNSYTKLDQIEYLICGGYEIQIDHEEHTFFIHKSSIGKKQDFDIDVKSLKKFFESEQNNETVKKQKTKLLTENNGIRAYQMTGMDGMKEIIFELDINRKKIKKIIYHYSENSGVSGQYMVLNYEKFEITQDPFSFELKNYFTQVNGKYTLNSKYKNYKLLTE